jgi:hypothetical protein
MADRIPIPGRLHLRRMRLIHAHASDIRPLVVNDRDLVRLLEHLHSEVLVDIRHGFGPTLVGRTRKSHARQRDFAVLLHDCGRPWFQDRIGVIADQLVVVAHAVAPRSVRHRAGSRRWRLEPGKRRVTPYAGEIRDRRSALRTAPGRPSRTRHRLPPDRRRSRCRQCGQQKEISLQVHVNLPFLVRPSFSGASWISSERPKENQGLWRRAKSAPLPTLPSARPYTFNARP